MRSNYKRLGDYIERCDEFNEGMQVEELQGISNNKYFQRSHTNTIGIDLTGYRVVRNNQFAFNRATTRNGDRISIALRNGTDCMVSPSYRIFKSKDENVLLSEYLMMWFRRPEFDRYARFKSHGSAHEFFDYEEMCEVELPIPSIEKQREIVKEYNTIVNRIQLNEQLNQKLEDTAQALYKQWFVDFEFPDEKGNPYKSSGGEMKYNEELEKEIPEDWEIKSLDEICDVINGRAYAETEFRPFGTQIIRIQNLNGGEKYVYSDFTLEENKYVESGDLIFAWSATFGPFIWRGPKSIYHYHIWKLNCKQPQFKFLLFNYFIIETKRVSSEGSGSIFSHITKSLMDSQRILIPNFKILNSFHEKAQKLDDSIANCLNEVRLLKELRNILLSKISTI